MEEPTTPMPIFNYLTVDGNCEANLYGEFIGDTDNVVDAELIITRREPIYIKTYDFTGNMNECYDYSVDLINNLPE